MPFKIPYKYIIHGPQIVLTTIILGFLFRNQYTLKDDIKDKYILPRLIIIIILIIIMLGFEISLVFIDGLLFFWIQEGNFMFQILIVFLLYISFMKMELESGINNVGNIPQNSVPEA